VANSTLGTPGASGDLDVSDVDSGEAGFQAAASLTGAFGDFTFNAVNGKWTYTLDQGKADSLTENQPATDTLTVKSLDGTASNTITANITGANDAPVAVADKADVIGISASGNVLTDKFTFDTDPDTGETSSLKVTAVDFDGVLGGPDDPVSGNFGNITMGVKGDWGYTLTKAVTDDADEVFDYTIVDEHGATASSTLTIHITGTGTSSVVISSTSSTPPTTPGTGANSAPDAVADDAYAPFGNVLANDTDVDGDLLNVTAISFNGNAGDLYDPLIGDYGFLMMDNVGGWTYTPTPGASGVDVFDYTIADGHGGMDSSTLTIHSGDFIL
jgi:VCBS repeat-containing protein